MQFENAGTVVEQAATCRGEIRERGYTEILQRGAHAAVVHWIEACYKGALEKLPRGKGAFGEVRGQKNYDNGGQV